MSDQTTVNFTEVPLPPPNFPLRPTDAAGSRAIPTLVFVDEDDNPKSFPVLNEVVCIGSKAEENDLVITGTEPEHAVLEVDQATITIRKISNGEIKVNNVPVDIAELQPGDVIKLNAAIIVLSLDVLEDEEADPPWQVVPSGIFDPEDHSGSDDQNLTRASLEWLTKAQQVNDLSRKIDDIDFEDQMLKYVANQLIEMFGATYSFAVILEEDGKNPAMVEKSFRTGHVPEDANGDAPQDTKARVDEAASYEINEAVLERALEAKTVIDFNFEADSPEHTRVGLAARVVYKRRCLGLIYFERPIAEGEISTLDIEMLDLTARVLALPISHILT